MAHPFRITVEALADEAAGHARPLVFEVSNHDDLIKLVSTVRALSVVGDSEAEAFTIGLKLLGNVLMHHRRDPLFAEFFTQFGYFMKKLKEHPQAPA